jgi:hypothetical protein
VLAQLAFVVEVAVVRAVPALVEEKTVAVVELHPVECLVFFEK